MRSTCSPAFEPSLGASRVAARGQDMFSEPAPFGPPAGPGAAAGGITPALSANVLVLNKFYQAIRVVNVRRAFSLLCRELAEVVHIETDEATGQARWQNFDFESWRDLSALKKDFEPDGFDWIHTVRFQIAVPR